MKIIRCLVVSFVLFFTAPALAGWEDLIDVKSREAGEKAQNRAGQKVDEKVDATLDCVFNPSECARRAKPAETPPAEKSVSAGPPTPPSATRSKAGPPPPPSARIWHIDVGGGQTREVNEAELASMIRSGEVGRSTPVWTEAFGGEFMAAGEVADLNRHFSGR